MDWIEKFSIVLWEHTKCYGGHFMLYRNESDSKISEIACAHTIKKFELIEAYVKEWAPKLLNYHKCNGIVFIDCMCNSGLYKDDNGRVIFGSPIRIAKLIYDMMKKYPKKEAWLYFNDLSHEKIELLTEHLPGDTDNFHIKKSFGDGNDLLKSIANDLQSNSKLNYLLVYDPYDASVDWTAIEPFLCNWGEVIINHMVSDPIRGVMQAKRDITIKKYERTYLTKINDLIHFGSDKSAYEDRIQEIIEELRGDNYRKYYIASFPFFNKKNTLVYNLLHCSENIKGFRLFKKTAWKTFGGKSSTKETYGMEYQISFDLDCSGPVEIKTWKDDYCYYVKDIVDYLHQKFKGEKNVPLEYVWQSLDEHPVFPSEGYRIEIKKGLKDTYGDVVKKNTITFTNRRTFI
jgi:three-Cys-motif partner protein